MSAITQASLHKDSLYNRMHVLVIFCMAESVVKRLQRKKKEKLTAKSSPLNTTDGNCFHLSDFDFVTTIVINIKVKSNYR